MSDDYEGVLSGLITKLDAKQQIVFNEMFPNRETMKMLDFLDVVRVCAEIVANNEEHPCAVKGVVSFTF